MTVADSVVYRVTTPTRSNAKAWARRFEARLLEPGIVSYEDAGCGKALLTKESIENSVQSFIGRPLILTDNLKHQRVTPKDLEKHARGYITEVYYNSADGWFWCKGICHDDAAKDAINKVGFSSCAYQVTNARKGGEYHAIPYNEEILQFSGEHLAIVDNPRYEGAIIRLNSKPTTNMITFPWTKKKPAAPAAAPTAQPAAPAAAPAASVTVVDNAKADEVGGDTELEIPTRENGKTEKVTLEALVTAYNARNDGLAGEDLIQVDGKEVAFKDIIAGYKANAGKQNAADDDDKKKKDDDKDAKSKENDKTGEPAKPGKPAKPGFLKVILNARAVGSINEGPAASPDDIYSRVNRGAQRYGSATTAEKN